MTENRRQKTDNRKQKVKKLTVFCVLAAVFFYNGCGIVGILGTPSQYEKKIPAEYDLTKQKGRKVLVLVEQTGWLSTKANLRYYLTEAVRENLITNVKIPSKYVLSYKELSAFRSKKDDFSSLSPAAVGEALGADIVLLVTIEDYQISEVAGSGYYNGSLIAREAIYEAGGEQMWEGRSVEVGFDTGERGQEETAKRLVNACAYCITRYLYDCPEYKFKIFDEGNKTGWEE
jgi:hypothetical protein